MFLRLKELIARKKQTSLKRLRMLPHGVQHSPLSEPHLEHLCPAMPVALLTDLPAVAGTDFVPRLPKQVTILSFLDTSGTNKPGKQLGLTKPQPSTRRRKTSPARGQPDYPPTDRGVCARWPTTVCPGRRTPAAEYDSHRLHHPKGEQGKPEPDLGIAVLGQGREARWMPAISAGGAGHVGSAVEEAITRQVPDEIAHPAAWSQSRLP